VKFKIDHNLPVELAELLRNSGHDTATAFEQGLAEADDDTLAAHCISAAGRHVPGYPCLRKARRQSETTSIRQF
jgi:DNA-binding response OmpR family regulator